jgi:putative redox protein
MGSAPTRTSPHVPIEVDWVTEQTFEAGRADGPKIRIDGDAGTGPSPFDTLLAAIATCSASDVVTILKKQRTPVQRLHIRVEAQRVEETPRRLAAATLHYFIEARGATLAKASRAVELAITKYCSVRSSLIAEAPVTWTVDLKS